MNCVIAAVNSTRSRSGSPVLGGSIGGWTVMRKRAPPTRSFDAGTTTAPSFNASAAGAGVVKASRPKKGIVIPSLAR